MPEISEYVFCTAAVPGGICGLLLYRSDFQTFYMGSHGFLTERPLVFLYNTFLIFTTTLIVYLFRRRVFWRVILTIFWMGLGIINGVLLTTRVTPFTGPDLHMITDAFEIADRYLPAFFFWVVVVLAVLAVLGLVLLFIKGPKYKGKLRYKVNIPLIIVGALAFAGTTKLALEKGYCPTILEILHLLMRITVIPTVWLQRFLTQESAAPEIIQRRLWLISQRVRSLCRRQEKADRISFFFSWSPF